MPLVRAVDQVFREWHGLLRWAWDAAAAVSLLLCAGTCVLWARAAMGVGAVDGGPTYGRHDALPRVALLGRYVAVSSHADGLAVTTVGGWPGGWPGGWAVYGP